MTAEIFLTELREALEGSVSPAFINENIRYYEEYIDTEKRKGRSEEEVMEELGEPRLIAKTIIDTAETGEKRGMQNVYDSPFNGEDGDTGAEQDAYGGRIKYTRISGGKALLIFAGIILLIIILFILTIVLAGALVALFWPVILGAFILYWILNPLKWD